MKKSLLLTILIAATCDSFAPLSSKRYSSLSYENGDASVKPCRPLALSASEEDIEEDEEPGTMRVAEIKSELDLRGINYSDCFDKESLAQKLVKARATGIADPSIIDQFNKQKLEEDTIEIDDEVIEKATSGDGTLPGGMPPDMLKQLMSSPELMELMNDPKMQDVMKLMMTGGQDALEIAMIEDKETFELVTKLNDIMGKSM